MFTSSRRLLSNELRVISNETFMILCSFVSKKLIAHPSLLTAHGSLYVMLNLVKHLTASLYLSFSADVSKKNTEDSDALGFLFGEMMNVSCSSGCLPL